MFYPVSPRIVQTGDSATSRKNSAQVQGGHTSINDILTGYFWSLMETFDVPIDASKPFPDVKGKLTNTIRLKYGEELWKKASKVLDENPRILILQSLKGLLPIERHESP